MGVITTLDLKSVAPHELQWENNGEQIIGFIEEIEDDYIIVGTCFQFRDFIQETQDLSDYIIGQSTAYDDEGYQFKHTEYYEFLMDDFENDEYYLKFYNYQKSKELIKFESSNQD